MKVFSTFFKIAAKNKFAIILYIAIFMMIAGIAGSSGQTQVTSFVAKKLPIAIIDRDQSETSRTLQNYLGTIHNLVTIADDTEAFQDELYYRNVSNIFIVPDGFEKSLCAGMDVAIESIEIPNSMYGIYVNMQFNQIINTLRVYLTSGSSPSEAMERTQTALAKDTKVTIQSNVNQLDQAPAYNYFYQYVAYVFLGIMTNVLGMILLAFNSADVRKRTICSALPLKKRNLQMTMGCSTLAIGIWAILQILPFFLYKDAMLEGSNYGYYLINTFSLLLFTISLGFLVGIISKKEEHISIYSTSFSLVFCFLGGVFVPLSIMSEKVVSFCKIIPTYWYVLNNTLLGSTLKLTSAEQKEFWSNTFILLCFTIVIFGISIIVTKRKNERA